jgi:DUF2927 family protein
MPQSREHQLTLSSRSKAQAGGRQSAPALFAVLAALVAALLAAAVPGSRAAHAEDREIAARRSTERTDFTSAEIADGFFKVAFGAELRIAGSSDRVRKFEAPVRVFLDNRANANRRADLAAVIADIRSHVAHLDVAMTEDRKAANIVVTLVRDRAELGRTIRAFYGTARAKAIEQRLAPQCLSGFAEDGEHRIRRAEVLLTVGESDFDFFDCAYEELLQALGPINDDSSVPWTMFNDEVQMGFFDVYDQYILNILYDPRVRPGMTRQQIRELFPEVLPTVRSWISRINGLPGEEARNQSGAVDRH